MKSYIFTGKELVVSHVSTVNVKVMETYIQYYHHLGSPRGIPDAVMLWCENTHLVAEAKHSILKLLTKQIKH